MTRPVEGVATGTIFGVALNYHSLLDHKLSKFEEAPYKAPPTKPVLFIKTPNTRNRHGGKVVFPSSVERLQPGPAIAVVIGKQASRVNKEDALYYVSGLTIVNEFSLPEDSYYRPAVKAKCRDGFCPLGPALTELGEVENLNDLSLKLFVNDELRQEGNTSDWVRTIPELLEDITEFMTLNAGDVLITGTPGGRVDVSPGDQVVVEVPGLGSLSNTVVAE